MSSPSTIILPGVVARLERFLRPTAATSGDGIQIHQDARGTTVIACEGRHAATITTKTAGSLEPILVDPAAFADVDPSHAVKLYRLTPTSGAVLRPSGELATVAITPGELPRSAQDLADVVEGEIASGSTRAVFELDPGHLLAVAEALVATGAEKVTIAVAPRWNVLAATTATAELAATFLIAGENIESPATPPAPHHDPADPLSFTIGQRKPPSRQSAHPGCASAIESLLPDDLPF